MKDFLEITLYELKTLVRTKQNHLFLPILLYFMYYSINGGVTNLTLSGYVVQILILGSMIISYQSFIQDYVQGYEELLQVIGRRHIYNSAKLFANIFFVILTNTILLLVMLIFAFYQGQPEWIIYEAVKYIILYYYISSIISVVIGASIALLIKNKIGYAVLISVGIFIGPLGKGVLETIATILNIGNLNDFINMINIGQYDVNEGFNFLYGFEIEIGRFIHRGIYLLSVITVFYIITGLKEKREQIKYIITIIFLVILLLPLVNETRSPRYIYKPGLIGDDAKSVHDNMYYQNLKAEYKKPTFEITKIKAVVDTTRSLEVKGDFYINVTEDTSEINLTLYRDFIIKEISFNGNALSYIQEDDNISVLFPKLINKGQEICLKIEYEGLSSHYFFCGEKATLLPAYYNWLPYAGETTSMYMENSFLKTSPLHINTPVSYDIEVKSNNKIASNIINDTNHIIGTSNTGISLISGKLYNIEDDNCRYFYTMDIPVDEMQNYVKKISEFINMIEKDLGVEESKIKQTFFVPFKEEYLATLDTNYVVNSMKIGDTLYTSSYPDVEHLNDEYYVYEAIACVFNSNMDFVVQDLDSKTNMVSAYINYFVSKNNINTELTNEKPEDMDYWIERSKELSW